MVLETQISFSSDLALRKAPKRRRSRIYRACAGERRPPGAYGDPFASPAPGPLGSQLSPPTKFSRRGFPGDPHAGPLGVDGFKWPAATAADPDGASSTTFDWKCALTLRVLQTSCAEAVCGFLNIQRAKFVEVFVRSFGRWSQRLWPKFLSVSYVQEKEGRVEPTGSTLEPQPPVL